MKREAIAVWYGGLIDFGVEIYDINSDYVIYRWLIGLKTGRISRAPIHYNNNDEAYFVSKGYEIKLSECMRV